MKKNFFKFLLLGAFTLSLGAGFVGCQDYDAQIDELQEQINDLKALDTKAVTDVALNGSNLTVTYSDGTTKQLTLPAGTESVTIELKNNTLFVDGVDKGKVDFSGALSAADFGVSEDGYLTVGGTKTSVKLNNGSVNLIKDDAGKLLAAYIVSDNEKYFIPVYNALTDLQFLPAVYEGGIPVLEFYRIAIGKENKGDHGVADAVAKGNILESEDTATFRTLPVNANVAAVTDWSFWNRAVTVRATEGEDSDLLTIIGDVKAVQGGVEMKVKANFAAADGAVIELPTSLGESGPVNFFERGTKKDVVVLEAKLGGEGYETTVTSDDVQVNLYDTHNVAIFDLVKWAAKSPEKDMYANDLTKAKADAPQHKVGHKKNGAANTFDLLDYVIAATDVTEDYKMWNKDDADTHWGYDEYQGGSGYMFFDLPSLQIPTAYKFTSLTYLASDNTDQSFFVELNGSKVTIKSGDSSIGRTPLFQVDLLNAAGGVMATHYIKFEITREIIPSPKVDAVELGDIPYQDLYGANAAYLKGGLPWAKMNEQVYNYLGLSNTEFVAIYGEPSLTTDHKTAGNGILADKGTAVFNTDANQTSSTAVSITIDPETSFGPHKWTAVFTPTSAADQLRYPTVEVVFNFNLVAPAHPAFSEVYTPVVNGVRTTDVKGKVVGSGPQAAYDMQATITEAFDLESLNNFKKDVVDTVSTKATHMIYFYSLDNKGAIVLDADGGVPSIEELAAATQASPALNSGKIAPYPYANPTNETFLSQEIDMSTPISIPVRTYDVIFRSVYENTQTVDTKWQYTFYNPLDVTLSPIVMQTKQTATIEALLPHVSVTVKGIVDVPVWVAGVLQDDTEPYGMQGNPQANNLNSNQFTGWSVILKGENASELGVSWDVISEAVADPDGPFGPGVGSPAVNGWRLTWENEGTAPSADITTEKIKLVITTPYAIKTIEQPITLKAGSTTTTPAE
jgi:hypothetical protein